MSNKKSKKTNLISSEEKKRLVVFKSNKNIYAQIVDDEKGSTIVSASSIKEKNGSNIEAAKEVGKKLASDAKEKKVKGIIFDRNRYIYKGRVKALADAARDGGLKF
jgi:large subunit ribosomal protein L18